MTLLERIKWTKENMRIPKILINEDEFEEVENALMKQDGVKPYLEQGVDWKCSVCDGCVGLTAKAVRYLTCGYRQKYCANCGTRQNWEGCKDE